MQRRRRGRPLAFVLTLGHRREQTAFRGLLRRGAVKRRDSGRPKLRPRMVVGDRGCTGRPVRDYLWRHGIGPAVARLTDRTPHRERNVAERLVGRLKACRQTATPYDKLPPNDLAIVQLPAVRLWLGKGPLVFCA